VVLLDLTAKAQPGLVDWLEGHDVPYSVSQHAKMIRAWEAAQLQDIDPHAFAKTIAVVGDDGTPALMVLSASDRLDLRRAAEALGTRHARLMSEEEMREAVPDCDVGTIVPIAELCELPVYADAELRTNQSISFHAGTHQATVCVDREAWERTAGVRYAELARRGQLPYWVQLA
jgi:prolyl-tRNA editing enzyme YbaK/EbsC (Cys-tRNA(Pro) deacylase)